MSEHPQTSGPQRNEVAGLAALGAHLVNVLSRPVQGTHRVIATHVFGALGPVAAPVRRIHDACSAVSYAGVRSSATVVARAVAIGSALLPPALTVRAVTSTAAGSVVVGAMNGLLGDYLLAAGSPLAVQLGPHHGRAIVGLEAALLAVAHPQPTGHLVVLVHGLGETEQAWSYRQGTQGNPVADLTALGATPIVLRYNTGRPVEDNGAELARVLTRLVDAWPVPVRRIDLVGHSMGGLVLRDACSRRGTTRWLPLVHTAAYLGTPHQGAALARGAARLASVLRRRPETRPWAELLEVRSAGILDLERAHRLPLVPGVRHVAVAGILGRNPAAWWAGAVGDGLVSVSSARHTLPELHLVPATGHLALLTEPRVSAIVTGLAAWPRSPLPRLPLPATPSEVHVR